MAYQIIAEYEIPRVSVVIVNLNGKDHLAECLPSIETLNFPKDRLEVVVVDNDSSDGSVEWLTTNYPKVRVIRNQSNVGFAPAVNQGVKAAQSDYVALLNNDAKVDPDWLLYLLTPLMREPDVTCTASRILTWDGENIDFVGASLSYYGHGFKLAVGESAMNFVNESRPLLFPCGGAMMVEKRNFLEVGGFDEEYFAFFEDVDYGWRLWVMGYRVLFCPQSTVYHRHHGTTARYGYDKERYLLERNALYTVAKNYDDERFHRLFPLAALLAFERGVVETDLKADEYSMTAPIRENSGAQIPKLAAAHFVALRECLRDFPKLMEKRAWIQSRRKRNDNEILRMFGEPFRPNILDGEFASALRELSSGLGVAELFGRPNRVLVISNDTIGERMAGPAIRCWEFARVLSREHDVVLATPNKTTMTSTDFRIRHYDRKVIEELVDWCDVLICQGFILHHYPFLKTKPKPIVVDIYDPFTLEFLELFKYKELPERENLNVANLKVLNDQLLHGDFFICASEKQRDYWIGMLCSLNRINPVTYDVDKTLRSLIDVVPFGLPGREPVHKKSVLKGVHPKIAESDKLIIWGGGIYNWFDPITLVRAMAKIIEQRQDVKLFFLGIKHPNPHVPEMRMCADAIELSKELGLYDENVFFNYDWVPYEERESYLLEADIGVSTHLDHVETSFSFRTRLLDYLWAGLPIVTTGGDSMSELVERLDLGRTVASRDVEGLVFVLLELCADPELRHQISERVKKASVDFKWDSVVEPLNEFCRNPRSAPDKIYDYKQQRAALRDIEPERKSIWHYVRRFFFHLSNEGWKGVSLHGRNLVSRTMKVNDD